MSTLKVVLLGDLGVGKTCLRLQFVHHVFTNAYKATIGGDYLALTVELAGGEASASIASNPKASASTSTSASTPTSTTSAAASTPTTRAAAPPASNPPSNSTSASPTKVNLQVWDTAGQERFNSISQAFYRGADVVILVYDITNYESLLSVREWFARFLQHCQVPRPGVMIVGTKTDRANDRIVDLAEIRDVLCRNANLVLDRYVGCWDKDLVQVLCKLLEAVEQVFQRAAAIGSELHSVNHVGNKVESIDLGATRTTRCAC